MDSGGGIDGPQEIVRPVASGQSATVRLRVLGRVQGVGFRPFVVWLAVRVGLAGWIKKTPEGVVIHIEGPDERLERELPPAAEIHAVTVEEEPGESCAGFSIRPSEWVDEAPGGGGNLQVRVVITPTTERLWRKAARTLALAARAWCRVVSFMVLVPSRPGGRNAASGISITPATK
ncbi:MAG: acylphosphatase [Isosphaeraceae bacterium]